MQSKDIVFDSRLFSGDAVKNAAYRLANVFDSDIRLDENQIICTVKMRTGNSPEVPEELVSRFRREVIDHELRLKIRRETEATRNLILSLAFSKTGLISND